MSDGYRGRRVRGDEPEDGPAGGETSPPAPGGAADEGKDARAKGLFGRLRAGRVERQRRRAEARATSGQAATSGDRWAMPLEADELTWETRGAVSGSGQGAGPGSTPPSGEGEDPASNAAGSSADGSGARDASGGAGANDGGTAGESDAERTGELGWIPPGPSEEEAAWEEIKGAGPLPGAGPPPGAAPPGAVSPPGAEGAVAAAAGAAGIAATGAAAPGLAPLGEGALPEAPRHVDHVRPPETTTIADLARAHEQASVEQDIARDLTRRRQRKRWFLATVGLALVGAIIGGAGGVLAVSRMRRGGGVAPKVGLADGLGGTLPTGTVEPTSSVTPTQTGAQVAVIILGLGDGSNETSANLGKFTVQRLPLTYGIYPQRSGTANDAAAVQASGGQAILYQPVGGTDSAADGERGEIEGGMSNRRFVNTIIQNAAGITSNSGIAPYGYTAGRYPPKPLRLIPVAAMRQSVFLLESIEGTGMPLAGVAARLGVPYLGADLRLDSKDDEKTFRSRWQQALEQADKEGRVAVVCRLSGLSARVLPSLLASLDTSKYTLTLASSLAR